jgi:hypothetical protein
VVGGVLILFLTRLGSLHALEQTKGRRFWRTWLHADLPSADRLGEVFALLDTAGLRDGLYQLYRRFRRRKVLRRPAHGLLALILDGHESAASYRRCCPGCLHRRIRTATGERVQYYHRHVTALLEGDGCCFLLDLEPQLPGEDEVAAAWRLFERIVQHLPRAFDVVLVDSLYAQAPFFRRVLEAGKEIIAVLKNEERDLMQDVRSLFVLLTPQEQHQARVQRLCWDVDQLTSWPQLGRPVRVVRTLETRGVRRQRGHLLETERSEWVWVTTLSQAQASTRTIVELGHRRWAIENEGFNELVTAWHADHLFHHEPKAILHFTLVAYLAYDLFHAFISRNLNPALRGRHTSVHWAVLMASDLFQHGDRDHPLPMPP